MGIYVTKPFLPPKEEFLKKVSEIFDKNILTNQGPNVIEFEQKMRDYLNVQNFHYVTNGTIALQLALRAMDIVGCDVITTPFSYVATISSILWEHCTPIFVDIEPEHFTIDCSKIEAAITSKTKAIMPVHVFGYACNVDEIEKISKKNGLKVIYDAAHTFGSFYNGKALCSYGDISTLSFHATKLFHTIEGGACIAKEHYISEKIELIRRFGHNLDEYICLGINAKQDEFNAAMGNINIRYIDDIIAERKRLSELYDSLIKTTNLLTRPSKQKGLKYNFSYYPVLFKDEGKLVAAFKKLAKLDIFPRRYFYPSLNTLNYLNRSFDCPVSEDIAARIACLPLYVGLEDDVVRKICMVLNSIAT